MLKIDPKWVPNRIIKAEDVRKPLDRPLDGSWRGLEGSWSALGVLLERLQGRESARGELGERSGRARGGVREGFSTLSPWAKGVKGIKGLQ